MKKSYNVKYIPTGNVFLLEKEEADRLLREEPENFSVVDDDYALPPEEEKEPVIYDKIVEQEEKPAKVKKKK